ncbi:hypothetical protein CM49_02693 [Paenibacillus sp. P1XP2]|nr:hypothetical protein CM49_02693 [Paenibacillus sp. P1XP2]
MTSIHESNEKISTLFLKIMLIFGMLMVFVTPPFQMADEDSHFKKAFLVSKLVLLPEKNTDGQVGNFVPDAILNFENAHRYLINDVNQKYDYSKFYNDAIQTVSYNESTFVEFSTTKTNPLLYLPQAVSMFFTKIIYSVFGTPSPATYMYAGRIGNLLFYTLIMSLALKYIPFYKRLFLLLAVMPMSIGLASSLNYDAMVIATCFLATSLIFFFAYENTVAKINIKHIVTLSVLSIVLIELKQVYFPILLLMVLIPKYKFGSSKIMVISLVLGIGVVSHLLWMLISSTSSAAPGDESLIKDQLMFIINNPFTFIAVLIRTLYHLKFFYINSFVGNLGWLDTNFSPVFIIIYFVLLLIVAVFDTNHEIKIPWKTRSFILLIFISILTLVETSLYLIWTSIPEIGGVGSEMVSGVQGRYFIPFSIIGLLIFYSNKVAKCIKLKISMIIDQSITAFVYFSSALTLFLLIIRYWIPAS